MTTRRQLRAGTAPGARGTVVPAHLARFDPADWPPTAAEPDTLTIAAGDPNAHLWRRFFARQRWTEAQRRWCAENGMTLNELQRLLRPARIGRTQA